uniref:Uncharacterized protein n=1 Tax=Anguilla anguilla TaxID=7936 RepID=A0A0E9XAM5_ANGAN
MKASSWITYRLFLPIPTVGRSIGASLQKLVDVSLSKEVENHILCKSFNFAKRSILSKKC